MMSSASVNKRVRRIDVDVAHRGLVTRGPRATWPVLMCRVIPKELPLSQTELHWGTACLLTQPINIREGGEATFGLLGDQGQVVRGTEVPA